MSLFTHHLQSDNVSRNGRSRTATFWQTPNPPPQQPQNPYQQQPPYGNQPPSPGQNPWDPPPPGYGGPPMPYQYYGRSSLQGRQVIGGLLILFGVIVILLFAVMPWVSYDSSEMESAARDFVRDSAYAADNNINASDVHAEQLGFDLYDGCKVTGLQVATRSEGNSNCPYELVEANFNVSYEPDLQPIVEYSVFAMPILGFLIIVFGIMLIANTSSSGSILSFGLVIAIALTIFPFGWTQAYNVVVADISEHNAVALSGLDRFDDRDTLDFIVDLDKAYISSSYQTIPQTIVPVLILITVVVGFLVASGNKPPQFQPLYGQPMNPYQQQPPPPPRY